MMSDFWPGLASPRSPPPSDLTLSVIEVPFASDRFSLFVSWCCSSVEIEVIYLSNPSLFKSSNSFRPEPLELDPAGNCAEPDAPSAACVATGVVPKPEWLSAAGDARNFIGDEGGSGRLLARPTFRPKWLRGER
eukprot:FR735329.1.p2 GENE.FR735329.1~~FR735329.1.p2  ORF type:complete len:134 (-),score=5.61 FR735329.1:382-783(-)